MEENEYPRGTVEITQKNTFETVTNIFILRKVKVCACSVYCDFHVLLVVWMPSFGCCVGFAAPLPTVRNCTIYIYILFIFFSMEDEGKKLKYFLSGPFSKYSTTIPSCTGRSELICKLGIRSCVCGGYAGLLLLPFCGLCVLL